MTGCEKQSLVFGVKEHQEFRRLYEDALKYNREVFTFQGREVLVGYARYVLDYLDHRLGDNIWKIARE